MGNMDKELALLTDDEAELCLNGLLKRLTISDQNYERLLNSPEEMKTIISTAASDGGGAVEKVSSITPQDRKKAIRLSLAAAAEHEKLGPELRALIEGSRPTLLEPVTTSLVLAGIIFVLSTDIKFGYENEDGKKKLKFSVEKSPTTDKLLEKFFGIFK